VNILCSAQLFHQEKSDKIKIKANHQGKKQINLISHQTNIKSKALGKKQINQITTKQTLRQITREIGNLNLILP
jgi:hypothetical protein